MTDRSASTPRSPLATGGPPHDRPRRRRRASATSAIPATSCAWCCGATALLLLVLFVELATRDQPGRDADLGPGRGRGARRRSASSCSRSRRSWPSRSRSSSSSCSSSQQRWRRLGIVRARGRGAAPALFALLDALLDVGGRVPRRGRPSGTWVASTDFPSLVVRRRRRRGRDRGGKPWLRAVVAAGADLALLGLVVVMAVAGSAGVPELMLAVAARRRPSGAAVLIAFGAPNRRPTPATVAAALARRRDSPSRDLTLERAEGGRAQLYAAALDGGDRAVRQGLRAGQPRRRPPLPRRTAPRSSAARTTTGRRCRSSRTSSTKRCCCSWRSGAGVRVPGASRSLTTLADGSMALAVEYVDGRAARRARRPTRSTPTLLDAVWQRGRRDAPRAHRAPRRCAPPTSSSTDGGPGRSSTSASARESAATAAAGHRPGRAAGVARRARRRRAGRRVRRTHDRRRRRSRRAAPYLQPLALSAATRKQASKALLQRAPRRRSPTVDRRGAGRRWSGSSGSGPRTLFMIAALVGGVLRAAPAAGRRRRQLRRAAVGELVVARGVRRHVAADLRRVAAIGLAGGVPEPLAVRRRTSAAQMASSFVNRVTPANVGGMALNVRFLQKAGIEPAEAVTGIGLNVARRRRRPRRAAGPVRRVGRARRQQQRSRSRRAASCS